MLLFIFLLFPLLSQGEFCDISYSEGYRDPRSSEGAKSLKFRASECLDDIDSDPDAKQMPLTVEYLNGLKNVDFEFLDVKCSGTKKCGVTMAAFHAEIERVESDQDALEKIQDETTATESPGVVSRAWNWLWDAIVDSSGFIEEKSTVVNKKSLIHQKLHHQKKNKHLKQSAKQEQTHHSKNEDLLKKRKEEIRAHRLSERTSMNPLFAARDTEVCSPLVAAMRPGEAGNFDAVSTGEYLAIAGPVVQDRCKKGFVEATIDGNTWCVPCCGRLFPDHTVRGTFASGPVNYYCLYPRCPTGYTKTPMGFCRPGGGLRRKQSLYDFLMGVCGSLLDVSESIGWFVQGIGGMRTEASWGGDINLNVAGMVASTIGFANGIFSLASSMTGYDAKPCDYGEDTCPFTVTGTYPHLCFNWKDLASPRFDNHDAACTARDGDGGRGRGDVELALPSSGGRSSARVVPISHGVDEPDHRESVPIPSSISSSVVHNVVQVQPQRVETKNPDE